MSGRLGCVTPALSPYTPCLTAERRAASTVAALSLSVVSSVSLVIVNKYLISTLGFPYGALPPCVHLPFAAQPRVRPASRLAPLACSYDVDSGAPGGDRPGAGAGDKTAPV